MSDIRPEDITQGLVVKPGDTVIIACNITFNEQMAHEATERLEEMMPGVRVVIVPDTNSMAIIRKDET